MFIRFFFAGLLIRFITGLDDTATRIPIASSIAHTRRAKFIFSLGMVIATAAAVAIAVLFSSFLYQIPNVKYFVAGFIFFIAVITYFDVFKSEQKANTKKEFYKIKRMTKKGLLRVFTLGFIISFITILDDIVAMTPLFLDGFKSTLFAILGITIATGINMIILIFFSEQVDKLPYKRQFVSLTLVILSLLVLAEIL